MEPVGLAVGVLGLAGLFSSCLEAIDKVQSYRSFTIDSQDLNSQFNAEKVRFEQWGQKISSAVKDLFLIIKRICESDDDLQRLPSKRRRLAWALRGKGERTEEVKMFGNIVQLLHHLAPPEGARGTVAVHELDPEGCDALVPLQGPLLDHGTPFAELRQLIARWEGEMEAEAGRKVNSWLLGRYSPNERYEESIEKKLDGTCDWILTRPKFLNWLSPDFAGATAKLLWLNGPAGFGKTILCARLVDCLSSVLETPVAYFFFSSDFESQEDPFIAIRSWISQIASRHTSAFDIVRQRWEAEQHQVATRATIIKLFQELLQTVPGCTLVADGLDECNPQNTSLSVASFLETVKQAAADTTTRLMFVSRNEPDIRHSLLGDMAEGCTEYKILLEDVQADTASYSISIVERKLPNKSRDVKAYISERMAERCAGQFLWLKLQEDCLSKGLNKKQLQQAIDQEPRALERLYERNWERITGSREREKHRAISLLRWAAFSLRPLTVGEITEAVLVDEDCDDFPIDELPDAIDEDFIDSEILGLCRSLLEIRGAPDSVIGLRTVHLTHFSVKQFLLQVIPARGQLLLTNENLRASNEASEHRLLAKMAIRYLNFHRVWQVSKEHQDPFSMLFRDYAASSWHHHAKSGTPDDADLLRLAVGFFNATNPNWVAWRKWVDSNDEKLTRELETETMPPNPLYYASRLNLIDLATYLLGQFPSFAAEKSSWGRTALGAACEEGHATIVKLLLNAGADITTMDKYERTPLWLASNNGHTEIVKLLLDKGADMTVASQFGWTPLNSASDSGHAEVVKLLLDKGADITVATHRGWTPLNAASIEGHVEVFKLLLDNGADCMIATQDGWTPLIAASYFGCVEIVKLLLSKEADLMAMSDDGWTPLNAAAAGGHLEVAKLLLDTGVDLTRIPNSGWSPLHAAADKGHIEVVKLLLDHGADPTFIPDGGWTPLNTAAYKGHIEVVKLLLDHGADLTFKSNDGWAPLNVAVNEGHVEVVKLLLDHGADNTAAIKSGHAPLDIAVHRGHTKVVKLLLDHGASVTIANTAGRQPLHTASSHGEVDMVNLLLERNDVSFSERDDHGRTALFLAARGGHHEVIEKLLATGRVAPAAKDYYGSTPLCTATRNGHAKAVEVLLSAVDPDLSSKDIFGRTLMWWARRSGNTRVIELLLQHAERVGIYTGGDTMVERSPVIFDLDASWCDACTLTLPAGSAHYYCEICSCGNFDICMECFEMGITCRDDSHMLVLRSSGEDGV